MTSIRIYSPHFPYPPNEGASLVIYNQCRDLAHRADVELVTWKTAKKDIDRQINAKTFEAFDQSIKLKSLAGSTSRQESGSCRAWRTLSSLLGPWPSPALFYYPLHAIPDFADQGQFAMRDLGIYHYSFSDLWARRLQKATTERKRVCYLHNLETDLFRIRAQASRNPLAKAIHKINAQKLERVEENLIRTFDELWFISELDLATYQFRYPQAPQIKLRAVGPTFTDGLLRAVSQRRSQMKSRHQGLRLGLLGSTAFAPYAMGLRWLIHEVLPSLQKNRFSGEIWLGGRHIDGDLLCGLRKFGFVKFLGFVEDLVQYYAQIDGVLVPHLAGSGVRMKLLEGLAAGLPVLCHPEAVASLRSGLRQGSRLRVASEPNAWTDAILDQPWWQSAAKDNGIPRELTADYNYQFLGDHYV